MADIWQDLRDKLGAAAVGSDIQSFNLLTGEAPLPLGTGADREVGGGGVLFSDKPETIDATTTKPPHIPEKWQSSAKQGHRPKVHPWFRSLLPPYIASRARLHPQGFVPRISPAPADNHRDTGRAVSHGKTHSFPGECRKPASTHASFQ